MATQTARERINNALFGETGFMGEHGIPLDERLTIHSAAQRIRNTYYPLLAAYRHHPISSSEHESLRGRASAAALTILPRTYPVSPGYDEWTGYHGKAEPVPQPLVIPLTDGEELRLGICYTNVGKAGGGDTAIVFQLSDAGFTNPQHPIYLSRLTTDLEIGALDPYEMPTTEQARILRTYALLDLKRDVDFPRLKELLSRQLAGFPSQQAEREIDAFTAIIDGRLAWRQDQKISL